MRILHLFQFIHDFAFHSFRSKLKGAPRQMNAFYSSCGSALLKIEPSEVGRNVWMVPPPRLPLHPHCKRFSFILLLKFAVVGFIICRCSCKICSLSLKL